MVYYTALDKLTFSSRFNKIIINYDRQLLEKSMVNYFIKSGSPAQTVINALIV